ncbi:MAG: hypothetical protein FJ399_10025 [Verrucomicrobia bacterium]|nr:hypothetical protein [Verrucomicrobiota bacterium]
MLSALASLPLFFRRSDPSGIRCPLRVAALGAILAVGPWCGLRASDPYLGDTCSLRPQIDEARAERANRLGDYLASAFRTGYLLGFGKCQYVDRPGTNSTAGIVNADNTPRRAYTDIITVRNRENLLRAFRAIDPQDSARANP